MTQSPATTALPLLRPYRPSSRYTKRSHSSRKLLISLSLALLTAASAASLGAYYYNSPPSNALVQNDAPAEAEPEQVTQAAMPADTEEEANFAEDASTNAQRHVSMRLQVSGGDTLLNMLTDTGVTYEEAYGAVQAVRKIYDPKKLDIGQNIAVSLDASNENPDVPVISSLSFPISQTASVHVTRDDSGEFAVKKIEAPLSRATQHVAGTINNSLYETGIQLGIPANLLGEMIKVYSYDVDFQRDIKRGNTMDVVFDKMQTPDGKTAGYGNLVYASLNLGDRTLSFYRYTDKSGVTDYYNAKGESLRKALLRTPINGARITSGFGMRMHPLLGYTKMHRGVDFGAAIGTPIYAAGDGTIAFAGTKGGYGNFVQIKHNDKYSTGYGHASRIAAGIKPGVHVRQGQVIAYVGSTGQSTGPHLHYEVMIGNTQVNPAGVKFKTGNTLSGKELVAFKKNVDQVQALAQEARKGKKQLASAADTTSSAKN